MIKQTIALFRFQLPGIINARLFILLVVILSGAFVAGQFVAELAIINTDIIALSVFAEILRYSLVIILLVSMCHQVSQDYELGQFERLLTMPVNRYQYVLSQTLVLFVFAIFLIVPVFLLMALLSGPQLALYWAIALFLELILVGHFALLASISLEKLPLAVILTVTLYLMAKSAPLIDLVLTQSTNIYNEELEFEISSKIFMWIQYLLPDRWAFAQNNVLYEKENLAGILSRQFVSVLVYSIFLQFVILVDFYRKELNQK